MGKANFSDAFKRDAVAQITDRGYPVAVAGRKRSAFLLRLTDNGRGHLLTLSANVLAIIRRCSVSVAWRPRIMRLVRSADLPAASSSRA